MYAINGSTITVARGDGLNPDIWQEEPAWMAALEESAAVARAAVVDGELLDTETLETVHVDASGMRHAEAGAGRQAVACGWSDPLTRATDGSWTCLTPLERAKADRRAAVNALRDQTITGGYQHNFGASAGIRTLDQRGSEDAINWLGLKGVADALIADGQGAETIAIRDAADETFVASATVVSSAMVAMGVWRSSVIAHSWTLKDAIAAAEDEAAVAAIDIAAGWPD